MTTTTDFFTLPGITRDGEVTRL